jgi:TonB family protein
MYRFCSIVICSLSVFHPFSAQNLKPNLRVAILDFSESIWGRATADKLATNLKSAELSLIDRDQSRAAAQGNSYVGSLNLTKQQARDLGDALGCDFYIIGDAQTVRRSPSAGPAHFESYASLFLISARSGELILWERLTFNAADAEVSQKALWTALLGSDIRDRFVASMRHARENEQQQRLSTTTESHHPVIEEAPADEKAAEETGLRLPRAFKRLRPPYPDSAAIAEAEATVDVLVDIDVKGDVTRVEIDRWAGFGLDEATVETVRQLRFFPALRNGTPVPIRVLLRYNFRKPVKETAQ